MAEAVLLCEAVSTRPVEPPQATQGSGSSGRAPTAAAAASKEEGSSTLMHYRPRLQGVRIADDGVSKDVLSLLFQLVQWQMRKADKFREVLPPLLVMPTCHFLGAGDAVPCFHRAWMSPAVMLAMRLQAYIHLSVEIPVVPDLLVSCNLQLVL